MKTLKFISLIVLISIVTLSISSCKKCNGEDPSARIINNGTKKASVQIKTSGGNTININNVDPSTSSPYVRYAVGTTTFTITVSNVNYSRIVEMSQCYDYDISIDASNYIFVNPIDRNN